MTNYEWMSKALCAQIDPEIFFPEDGRYDKAKQICESCPVRTQCAEQAEIVERGLCHTYRHGAWAGTSPRQRAHTNDLTFYQERAADIIRLASAGWEAKQIAAELSCTDRTVWRVLADHRSDMRKAA